MCIPINLLQRQIFWIELLMVNKLIQILLLSLKLRELEKIRMICFGLMVKFMVQKIQLMLVRKNSELAVEIQRKFKILLTELMIKKSHFLLKILKKVLKLFINLLRHTKHLSITPMENNTTHLIERSFLLYLSSQLEELKKLLQKKDKKNGLFSNKCMEALGINLISLNSTFKRKLLSLIMKITLTNIFLKPWILKVMNSRL